jgi:hypothetical protein
MVRSQATGHVAFDLSEGGKEGNRVANTIEITDEDVMVDIKKGVEPILKSVRPYLPSALH